MKIINPATEEIIRELKEDTREIVSVKFDALRVAQPLWGHTRLGERILILKKFSDLLKKNSEHLASVLTSEVGKPLQQSRNEINGAQARIQWLAENASKYLADEWMTQG